MAGHKRSSLLPQAACPSVSPDILLAVRGCASSPDPCSLCHSFSPCRWPAASLCWWPSVSNFFHCNFNTVWTIGIGSKEQKARTFSSLSLSGLPASKDMFSYFQRVPRILVPWQTIDTRGLLDLETFLPDRSSKYQQTDPRKSAKKIVQFLKKLTCSSSQRFSRHPFVCAVCHSKPRVLWMEIRRSRMSAFLTSYAYAFCTVTWRDLVLHVRKNRKRRSLFYRELYPFKKFAIPLENLQFHWSMYPYERGSVSTVVVTSSWSECLSDQRFAAKLCARWAAKRRLISNVRHGVISLSILANKPSSFR